MSAPVPPPDDSPAAPQTPAPWGRLQQWWAGLSLRASLLWVLGVTLVTPALLLLVVGQRIAQTQQQTLLAEAMQSVMVVGAASLGDPMWAIDMHAIEAAMRRLLDNPAVVGVRVREERPDAQAIEMGSPTMLARLQRGEAVDGVVVRREDIFREGLLLGSLQVWFDTRLQSPAVRQGQWQLVALVLLQMCASLLVLSVFLTRRVARPVERLKALASAMVAHGAEPSARTERRRLDELGQLGRLMFEVQQQLQDSFGALEEKNRQLQHMALYDALTGLPNRNLFRELVEHDIGQAQRAGGRFGLLFVDLDRFKTINDALGHAMGDQLLIEVAHRLRSTLREADVACRQSGDEFMVLARQVVDWQELATLSERLLHALARPVLLGNTPARVSGSIGIAMFPDDASDFETLVKHADVAMYQAKSLGRARYSFFLPEFNTRRQASVALEQQLSEAIERREFVLHYQPQVHAQHGHMVGCEALLRWHHPARGLLAPGEFITMAEESGLIAEMGLWVRDEACAQLARWKAEGLRPGVMAINVSALEFRDHRLVDSLRDAMMRHDIAPQEVEVELTESALMADSDTSLRIIDRLVELGVRLAIDDFGTGYSSLAYLKRLRPHQLKIDRSFVRDIATDADDRAIVKGVIGLASTLGMDVTAEGVEDEDQRSFLCQEGCTYLQGYGIARPMPAEDMARWMRERVVASA
ncbi:putative bifunctional diguanylate cyclase/phosphodiesterase [Hydrogenophaga defluvii]|uniref:Bifunctional diguanylate cyclase/phosphodiesterase n=1 Tax=Hydrogenophaga defluvii TaxID=249410 RepID=A0ABW2SEY3_9BURK